MYVHMFLPPTLSSNKHRSVETVSLEDADVCLYKQTGPLPVNGLILGEGLFYQQDWLLSCLVRIVILISSWEFGLTN